MRTARLSFLIQSLGIVMLSATGHTLLIKYFGSLGNLSERLRMHRKAVGKLLESVGIPQNYRKLSAARESRGFIVPRQLVVTTHYSIRMIIE